MPSALGICQGKRDVSLGGVCKENKSWTTHETRSLCVHIPRKVCVCVTYFFYSWPLLLYLSIDFIIYIPQLLGSHSAGPFPCGPACQVSGTDIYYMYPSLSTALPCIFALITMIWDQFLCSSLSLNDLVPAEYAIRCLYVCVCVWVSIVDNVISCLSQICSC